MAVNMNRIMTTKETHAQLKCLYSLLHLRDKRKI